MVSLDRQSGDDFRRDMCRLVIISRAQSRQTSPRLFAITICDGDRAMVGGSLFNHARVHLRGALDYSFGCDFRFRPATFCDYVAEPGITWRGGRRSAVAVRNCARPKHYDIRLYLLSILTTPLEVRSFGTSRCRSCWSQRRRWGWSRTQLGRRWRNWWRRSGRSSSEPGSGFIEQFFFFDVNLRFIR